ncbi:MAG: amidase [Pseudomonadota bacterium]
MSETPWAKASARTIAGEVRAGRKTQEALIEAADAVVAARENDVKAFVHLEEASARRARLQAQARHDDSPLAGLPLGVKDIFDTFDLPTEYLSPIYEGHQPKSDATCVAQARAAGAAIFGKTVTTEFASFWPGPTCNPRNIEYSPGGSSSGSAAAVAAGMLPFALGTQTGGSVIRPAAFCGVVGYKPSYNLIPAVGLKTFAWSLDTVGIFANRVDDAEFLIEAMVGETFSTEAPSSLKIAYCQTPMADAADDETWTHLGTISDQLSKAGHTVKDLTLPQIFGDAHDAHNVINDGEGALSLMHERTYHRDNISDRLNAILDRGATYSPSDHHAAQNTFADARAALEDVWQDFDFILAPAAPGIAPKGQTTTGDSVFNRLWTGLGVPCVTLPLGTGTDTMPLGAQFIAPFFKDSALLAAAKAIEAAFD